MTKTSSRAATVPALYHPTIAVHDLDAARDWFRRVFNRVPLRWSETLNLDYLQPDYPVDYSFFAFISDIHWVFLCPPLHAQGSLSGQTRYSNVPDGMIGLGWYTDDAVDMFDRLAKAGFRAHDQQGALITTEKPPVSSFAVDVFTGFTEPADTGIRYEFQETGRRHWPHYAEKADPRLRPDWTGPELDPADPLGILRTSHHTIVTRDLARVLRLYLDTLGAVIVAEAPNDELAAESTFVRLADTVLEFAVPRPESSSFDRVADGNDFYQGVTMQVADVAAAGSHLATAGVEPVSISETAVAIPPATGFGAEWRFVAELPYPRVARREAFATD